MLKMIIIPIIYSTLTSIHLFFTRKWGNIVMYFIMYNQAEEIITEDIDQVISYLTNGWKLYGF